MAEAELSLSEELGKAFDEAESTNVDAGTSAAEGNPSGNDSVAGAGTQDTIKTERTRDESGKFVKAEAKTEVKTEVKTEDTVQGTQAQDTVTGAQGVDLPPTTWTAAAKAEYGTLSPVIKSEIRKREADFMKGIEQYKRAAEQGSEVLKVIGPQAQALVQHYGSVGNGIKALLDISNFAANKPQEFLQWFAQNKGINLGQQAQGDVQGVPQAQLQQIVSQLVQPYVQQFSQFQTQYMTAQQQAQLAQEQETQRQIESFRMEADEKGQPKHVYFDNVRGMMSALIGSGEAKSLEQAYEMACRAHPEVSTALATEQQRAAEAKRLDEARRGAADAKRAIAANVTGQGAVGMADTSKMSLRDELLAQMEGRL